MAKDGHTSCADQPKDRRDGRSPDTKRDANTQQSSVELRSVEAAEADVQVTAIKFTDAPKTGSHKDDDEEQKGVGQQAVDAEHNKDDGIVAGEVAQVVVDAALDLSKIGRLRNALEVEELGDGAQVGETSAQRLAAEGVEAVTETRGDRVNRDRDGHGECGV